jgi:tRNA(Ile)-lysidine synthase
VALDLSSVNPPLAVRSRRPGDRFRPLGLPVQKKLKELLIDAKIPAGRRSQVPLVCDRDGIIWVAGVRPAERCRVHAGTKRLLILELKQADTPPSRRIRSVRPSAPDARAAARTCGVRR